MISNKQEIEKIEEQIDVENEIIESEKRRNRKRREKDI